ncbi:hypothetical protein L9F63_005100, partial [Diploptera punctata]
MQGNPCSVSVLGLLQNVCSNPGAVLSPSVDHNVAPSLMETVVKQLVQLANNTSAGSPLKNGVRACTCIVHLVLLQ